MILIKRKVDKIGRIFLPEDMLNKLNILYGSEVTVIQEDDYIKIKKYTFRCIICGTKENLVSLDKTYICSSCLKKFNEIKSE